MSFKIRPGRVKSLKPVGIRGYLKKHLTAVEVLGDQRRSVTLKPIDFTPPHDLAGLRVFGATSPKDEDVWR